jgi:hypothetical protein
MMFYQVLSTGGLTRKLDRLRHPAVSADTFILHVKNSIYLFTHTAKGLQLATHERGRVIGLPSEVFRVKTGSLYKPYTIYLLYTLPSLDTQTVEFTTNSHS